MSHAPHIRAFPDAAPAEHRDAFYTAATALGERMREARPDAVAIISSDHFTNFGPAAMPAFAVGIADEYWGPVEDWLGIGHKRVAGLPEANRFADALMRQAFDVTVCRELALEHGMMIPLSFVDPDGTIPLLPIVQNCTVPPLPSLRRCFAFGQAVGMAAVDMGIRLAVVGAGGLSHAPGAQTSGLIDEEFDREFMATLAVGGHAGSADLFPNERIDRAGFGTWEIRQWFTAWGAAGGASGIPMSYAPIREWETGCAVMMFGE